MLTSCQVRAIDSGLVGSTDCHSSLLGDAARAEDAQGTPTQSHVPPSILVYEDYSGPCTTSGLHFPVKVPKYFKVFPLRLRAVPC
jgi:hypothetical protein